MAHKESKDKKKPTNLVQTIERMASIFEVLGNYPNGLSLGVLSEKVDLPKGTTHRLLTSMAYFDFIRQDTASKQYHLGFKLLELGNILLSHIDLRKEAHPYLVTLSEEVQETVHLVILDQNKALYIDKVDLHSRWGLQMVSKLGSRIPLHCSAVGKVLLAYMPEREADAIIQDDTLERLTGNTITDPVELKRNVASVREKGYAIDDEENEPGVRCIAAPIRNYIGQVVAAMSVSGATTRMNTDVIEGALKHRVINTAMKISHKLGFQHEMEG
ncbi:MAG TPA: IclR family transcriptional regulator [Syntrophales bacterium]|nr:IclR family transcriptional regulator [Syntrophales bacterium]HPQ45640.1 IclR family transcriptional regulator [Syntrophales bacterium]